MTRLLERFLIAAGLFIPVCSGQTLLDEANFKDAPLKGFHLVGISVYGGYSTSAYPNAGYALNVSTAAANLGPDESYGASVSLGYQYHRTRTDITVLYSGTYGGMVRYSELNAFSQSLAISANRRLTPKWTFEFSADGQDTTLAQFLYQPSALSVISQVPATFDDFAAAAGIGQFTDGQIASILTGSPIMQAPGRSLLVGDKILSYAAQAGVSYAASSRLHFRFGSFAAAGQTRYGGQDGVAPANYILPRSLGANASVGISYALSPRTDVGVDVNANRTNNNIQSAYVETATASFGRKMGTHWFLRAQGGGSYTQVIEQTIGAPKTRQLIGGGSLGFQGRTYSLVGSYNRSAFDTYGFAVGTNTTISGAWSWRRPGSRWSGFAGFGEQQTRSTGFASLSGWQASAGVSTRLDPRTTLSAQYVYYSSTGTYAGTPTSLGIHSVRLSLGWSPQAAVQR